ncbi:Hint domain-containing protein [Bordetella sp. BOR01]|uniref:Hint domain-containing protein n=1 Tax=Bordetella sp. BOR01 TaxID=2854779 RepID=UPI001C4602D7|nr:Hint domain-containing protein [Bordetella sp. BOR01]MBV7484320.1 Hint domain-containing protein [Bordetella sp. BOR01]
MADEVIYINGENPVVTVDQGQYTDDTLLHVVYQDWDSVLNVTNESGSSDVLGIDVNVPLKVAGVTNLNVGEGAHVKLESLLVQYVHVTGAPPAVYNYSIADGGTLEMAPQFVGQVIVHDLQVPYSSQLNIDFGGSGTSTLIFDTGDLGLSPSSSYTYPELIGMSGGDQLIIPGATSFTYEDGTLRFQNSAGGYVAFFNASGLDPDEIHFENGVMTYACYLKGTHIATPDGETRIEDLKAGDQVLTASGGTATVKWLGHRTLRRQRIPAKDAVRAFPILFKKDSIARNRPHRDLLLSPGHHVYFDGALIPAMLLVNGRTIIQQFDMKVFEYFHIELEQFDIVLAEGVPAESYVDTGNRAMFQNASAVALHPDFVPAEGRPHIEGITVERSGPVVEAVRKRLLQRAQVLTQSARVTDPDLRVEANGQEIRAQNGSPQEGVIRFALPAGAARGDVRICSRSAVVRETSVRARRDLRQVGVGLARITIEEQGIRRDLDLLDAQLGGLHAPQDAYGVAMRWTNGEAVIPAALHGIRGPAVLELHVLRTYSYWGDALQRAA